jgi:CubicO group peptidase (beta-lactamase class C family)
MYKLIVAFLIVFGALGFSAKAQEVPQIDDAFITTMEAIITTANTKFNVPGSAIAFVQNGEIVYSAGFGVRNIETGAPVTPETLFRTGSTLKSATALLIATMVDEGLLTWDTPVSQLLPNLQFPTEELTAELTIGEIMGHGTGLNIGVFPFYWDMLTAEDVISAQANASITGERGNSFLYNNDLFAIAGYAAVGAVGGDDYLNDYTQLMHERIFDPIGMDTFTISDNPTTISDNASLSYTLNLILGIDVPYLSEFMHINALAPAGGGVGSVIDMAKYIITHLNGGFAPDGTQIVSEENLLRTYEIQNSYFDESLFPTYDFATYEGYGMGWMKVNVGGIEIFSHAGGIDGFMTEMVIIPQANAGIVILSNSLISTFTNQWIMYEFVNQLYDLGIDTIESEIDAIINGQLAGLDMLAPLLENPEPNSEQVAPLLGEYENGWTLYIDDEGLLRLERIGLSVILLQLPMPNTYFAISGQPGMQITFTFDDDIPTLTIESPAFSESVRKTE